MLTSLAKLKTDLISCLGSNSFSIGQHNAKSIDVSELIWVAIFVLLSIPIIKVQVSQLIMSVKHYTLKNLVFSSRIDNIQQKVRKFLNDIIQQPFDPFSPFRDWLNEIEIRDRDLAHRLCKTIPSQCPFEREISLFGHTILSIPPLCKLNPLYNEVIALRFRAICYLADVCGEDVSSYC